MADPAPFDDVDLVQQAPGVLHRRLLDGLVVLAPGRDQPIRVTSPGDVLWRMLDEPCTIADLIDVWSTIYSISEAAARGELEPILTAWFDGGAIRRTSG